MRRVVMVLGAALLGAALTGCGSASVTVGADHSPVASESRDVHGIDRVEVDGTGTLTITQGNTEALTIQAPADILPKLRSDVRNGLLLLGPRPGSNIHTTGPIHYDLTIQRLSSVVITGAASAQSAALRADELTLDISGAGKIGMTGVNTGALTVKISGAGAVNAAGQAAQQTVTISGTGSYTGSDLASQRATVNLSGAGGAALRVSDQLNATVSGVGRVTYIGSPAVQQHVDGIGSVTKTG